MKFFLIIEYRFLKGTRGVTNGYPDRSKLLQQEVTGSTTVTIPSGAETGTYSIIAKAEADSTVAETNEKTTRTTVPSR